MECIGSNKFINEVNKEIARGFRFVPFIGSGISKPSGIIMGNEFDSYLSYVVYRILAPLEPNSNLEMLDLLVDGWPDLPSVEQKAEMKNWVENQFCHYVSAIGKRTYDSFVISEENSTVAQQDCTEPNFVIRLVEQYKNILYEIGVLSEPNFRNLIIRPQVLKDKYPPEKLDSLENELLEKIASFDSDFSGFDFVASFNNDKEIIYFDEANHTGSQISKKKILILEGIRALFDWRATLRFLSRLSFKANRIEILKYPNQSLIDGLVSHLVGGRKPNLSHILIAHLIRPLRIRLIMTTNFDSLLEQALEKSYYPFSVLAIGNNSELPSSEIVHSENVLLKLHGGKINTRADFSLDDRPSKKDLINFHQYLSCDSEIQSSDKINGYKQLNNYVHAHLLVMGFSGNDKRVMSFFYSAIESDKRINIFWICYSNTDFDALSKKLERRFRYKPELMERFHVMICPRQDLFLYELYQKLTYSLPPAGFNYEIVQDIPPDYDNESLPMDEKEKQEQEYICGSDEFSWYLEQITENKSLHGVSLSINTSYRVGRSMRLLFKSLSQLGYSCLWLELEDYFSPQFLATKLFQILSTKYGYIHKEHILMDVNEMENFISNSFFYFVKNIINVIDINPLKHVIFMYGRNGPGGCSAWTDKYWSGEQYLELERCLNWLKEVGFNIVYMPYSNARKQREEKKLDVLNFYIKNSFTENYPGRYIQVQLNHTEKDEIDFNKNCDPLFAERIKGDMMEETNIYRALMNLPAFKAFNGNENNEFSLPENVHDLKHSYYKFSSHSKRSNEKIQGSQFLVVLKKVMYFINKGETIGDKNDRLQLIYATTLFRQSRHPSAFYTEGVYPCPEKFNAMQLDNDAIRAANVAEWIDCDPLPGESPDTNLQVMFKKAGGYLWLYRDVRLGIRCFLENLVNLEVTSGANISKEKESSPQSNKLDFITQGRARIHFWLGEWYLRSFHSIGHSTPVIESIYHRFVLVKSNRTLF